MLAAPTPEELPDPPQDGPLPPMGLVLAGGGSKGGYQVGVVECLADAGIAVTSLSGTSIGALNAAVLASHDDLRSGARALATAWQEVMTATTPFVEETGVRRPANAADLQRVQSILAGMRSPVVKPGFLADLVARHVGRARKPAWVAAFPTLHPPMTSEPAAWVLDWVRAKAGTRCHWLPLHDRKAIEVRTAVLASAALPVVFTPVHHDGHAYRDGGYADNTPVGPLLEHTDANPIMVVHLATGLRWDHGSDRHVVEIRPTTPLTPAGKTIAGLLDFTPRRYEALRSQGYSDTAETLRRWLGPTLAATRLRTTTLRAARAVADLD
ncbi:patatin-like phospholipase family protein [Umezawaea sp. NPDC059074]|uniref:patatin-like phospholipase family protein n=1 Tax=Umezawaea sp. NPDC059074 TaxID=3346716 RepID=UPI003691E5DE